MFNFKSIFFYLLVILNSSLSGQEGIKEFGKSLEAFFRGCAQLPHYKYIAKPVYISTGGCDNPLVSVPASFAVTDLIMHRILPETVFLSLSKQRKRNFKINPMAYIKKELFCRAHGYAFIFWVALSLPLAWHKYTENKKIK